MDHGVHTSSVAAQYRRAAKNLTIDLNEKRSEQADTTVQSQKLELHDHMLACIGLLMVNV